MTLVMRILSTTLLVFAAAGAAALAQSTPTPFTVAESGRSYAALKDAVAAIGDGKGTVMIASGTYAQCAVQQAGDIAFRAQTPGSVILDGVACEGKAALVLRGRSSSIDGVIFQNIRVPDGNGAGIRLEYRMVPPCRIFPYGFCIRHAHIVPTVKEPSGIR